MESQDSSGNENELALLLDCVARQLCRSADLSAFLDWIAEAGPMLAPSLVKALDPQVGTPAMMFRTFGIQLYGMTPQPENHFQSVPVPKPGRNEPCFCGSGRKFKQCCESLWSVALLKDYNMLRHVLDQLPVKSLASLPTTNIDSQALADTAMQWLDEGEVDRAVALLEPWFKPEIKLKRTHIELFDCLMDAYQFRNNTRKRQALLERALQAEDKYLRVCALQRKATICMDKGQRKAAWECFTQAQRLDPDDPALALLEITMLTSERNIDKAKERARFWLARFRRSKNVGSDVLELLEACTVDPEGVLARSAVAGFSPYIDGLLQLLSHAPEISALYEIDELEPGVILQPGKKLAKAQMAWEKAFESIKPALTNTQHGNQEVWENADAWLNTLERNPILWNSFEVLDDLIMAADALDIHQLDPLLLFPLLERAQALLENNLAKYDDGVQLPWIIAENRPALRCMAHKVFLLIHGYEETNEDYFRCAEWLLKLNPNDNHGVRHVLMASYLKIGRPERAVALAESYPDDVLCELQLNYILALYCCGEKGKALTKLNDHAKRFSVAIKMLLADNPRQPKLSDGGYKIGGKDEAWYYREDNLHLWQETGALDWLRQAFRSVK